MKKQKEQKQSILKDPFFSGSQELAVERSKWFMEYLGIAIIILLGVGIYSNSFDCSFHFDDKSSIVDNLRIRNWSDIESIWGISPTRFISYYSLALNYHFGELNVWGYHLVNIIFHLLTSLLVYWLTFLILSTPVMQVSPLAKDKKWIALFTALLFVSHPLATQSVTYIVQRMACLVALFYLLSVALYVKARLVEQNKTLRNLFFVLSFLASVLAMITKENAFSLPFAIVLVELFFLRTGSISIQIKYKSNLIILFSLIGFIFFIVLKYSYVIFKTLPLDSHTDYREISSIQYLFTQFSVLIKYLQLLVMPLSQNLDYDYRLSNSFFEGRTIAGFLLILALFIIAIRMFKKYIIVSFGIFWFFLTIAIESSFMPLSDLIFEHRTYLPSFGFFFILSSSIYLIFWKTKKYLAMIIFLSILCSNSYSAYTRNKIWKDDLSLWSDVVSKSPNKARGYFNLALHYSKNRDSQKALDYYSKVIQLQPLHEEAYNNRGLLLYADNKIDQAYIDFNKMIELMPNSAIAYNSRGSFFINEKKYAEAMLDIKKSLELNPTWEAYNNSGIIRTESKDYEEAITDFKKSIDLNPNNPLAYYSSLMVFERLNDLDKAHQAYLKCISLNPNYLEAYFKMGNLYSSAGKFVDAILEYDKVLKINPKYIDAYNNKGNVYVSMEKYSEALNEFNKAIEINPGSSDSYNNRGTVYMGEKKYVEAIGDFDKAIELNRSFAMAYANRGICYLNSGQKIKGCADLERAIELGFQPVKEIFYKNCQ